MLKNSPEPLFLVLIRFLSLRFYVHRSAFLMTQKSFSTSQLFLDTVLNGELQDHLHSDCGYKIRSRTRKVGIVSEKSITRQQAGLVRWHKRGVGTSQPRWRADPVSNFLRRGLKEYYDARTENQFAKSGLVELEIHPLFDNLRGDSRFDALVKRIGIPD